MSPLCGVNVCELQLLNECLPLLHTPRMYGKRTTVRGLMTKMKTTTKQSVKTQYKKIESIMTGKRYKNKTEHDFIGPADISKTDYETIEPNRQSSLSECQHSRLSFTIAEDDITVEESDSETSDNQRC